MAESVSHLADVPPLDGEAVAIHEPDFMGVWGEDGIVWLPKSRHPKRSDARSFMAGECGCDWIRVKVYSRSMRHAPELDLEGVWGGEFWTECSRDTPGAFPVWRCE